MGSTQSTKQSGSTHYEAATCLLELASASHSLHNVPWLVLHISQHDMAIAVVVLLSSTHAGQAFVRPTSACSHLKVIVARHETYTQLRTQAHHMCERKHKTCPASMRPALCQWTHLAVAQ